MSSYSYSYSRLPQQSTKANYEVDLQALDAELKVIESCIDKRIEAGQLYRKAYEGVSSSPDSMGELLSTLWKKLVIYLTSADFSKSQELFREIHQEMRAIQDGKPMLSMTHLAEMVYQEAVDKGNVTQAPNDAHMLASGLKTLSQGTKRKRLGNLLSKCRQDVEKFHAALQVHTQAVETANKVFQDTFKDTVTPLFKELLQSLSTLLTAYASSYAVHYEVTGQTGLDQLEGDLKLPELRKHESLPEEVSNKAATVLYKLTLDKNHVDAQKAYSELPKGVCENSEASTWTKEDYPKILKFLEAVNKEEAQLKALAVAELPAPELLPTLPPGAENRYDALRGRQAAVKEVLLLKNTLDEKITAHRKQLQATSEESETKLTEAQKRNTNAQSAYKELQNKASEIKLNVENTKRGNEQGAERLSTYVGQQQKLLGTLDQAYKELEQNTGSNANEMWQRFQGDLRAKLGEKDPQKGSVAALRQVMKNSNELAAQKWHGGMAPDNKLEEVLRAYPTNRSIQNLIKAKLRKPFHRLTFRSQRTTRRRHFR